MKKGVVTQYVFTNKQQVRFYLLMITLRSSLFYLSASGKRKKKEGETFGKLVSLSSYFFPYSFHPSQCHLHRSWKVAGKEKMEILGQEPVSSAFLVLHILISYSSCCLMSCIKLFLSLPCNIYPHTRQVLIPPLIPALTPVVSATGNTIHHLGQKNRENQARSWDSKVFLNALTSYPLGRKVHMITMRLTRHYQLSQVIFFFCSYGKI